MYKSDYFISNVLLVTDNQVHKKVIENDLINFISEDYSFLSLSSDTLNVTINTTFDTVSQEGIDLFVDGFSVGFDVAKLK